MSATVSPYCASGMKSTSTDQSVQIENPMCSENTENHRLRVAIRLPVRSQNDGSSGRQSSIQPPVRVPASLAGALIVSPLVRAPVGRPVAGRDARKRWLRADDAT